MLFCYFFKAHPNKDDINKMLSFTGIVELIDKYITNDNQKIIIDGFAQLLWGKGAQGLVRDSKMKDYHTKLLAFNYLINKLDIDINEYYPLINKYYGDIYVR